MYRRGKGLEDSLLYGTILLLLLLLLVGLDLRNGQGQLRKDVPCAC